MGKTDLTISIPSKIILPRGTKIITNDTHVTLARRTRKGFVNLFTCHCEDAHGKNLCDMSLWNEYDIDELKSIIKIFK